MVAREGFAFVVLYVFLAGALVRPQMNISIVVDSLFFQANYAAVMVLTYKFDFYMLLAAVPLSGLTVFACTKWNMETEHQNSIRVLIGGMIMCYFAALSANVAANGMVMQYALAKFGQCPAKAWQMYADLQLAFLQSIPMNGKSLVMCQPRHSVRLVYPLSTKS
ncbi:uncharacterized protein LOC115621558 [Scaptodrosophila lebanonensis]|uniref:Uncharacterized protein LOC115621558 n=1 Tax=Drosophila lebanonensis TaxID=7225 RepID=A0A6J2T2E3_DROLE|nr:uncharacterized protein LOC115621558 [Scaptodrosophila lebanonensis]